MRRMLSGYGGDADDSKRGVMKRLFLPLIALLAACGSGDRTDGGGRDSVRRVQLADLTGLYEAPDQGGQRARMCMISEPRGGASFAIVIQEPDGRSCGGAGKAVRTAGLLRLTMAGEGDCVIDARIAGGQLVLPRTLPRGCAYYCAAGATLAGAVFEKTGGTREDARRAADLAGDPLCG